MPIQWESWSADAFARARSDRKPVLLSVAATWCASCGEMDRISYADPRVVAIVRDRFVPVRVDADRRPDIADRYSLGGLPTTAFLTADGGVMGGGTFVEPDRLADVLERAADLFASRGAELEDRSTSTTDPPAGPRLSAEELTRQIYAAFDPEFGGFGGEPKFPLSAPLELALQLYGEAGDEAPRRMLELTLDTMGWSPLYDEVDGGFFRVAGTRDWHEPQFEKLLEVNAALLGVFAAASRSLDAHRYAERAQDVVRYVQTWLADPVEGGWSGSQAAGPAYYAGRTPEARRGVAAPPVDGALYATGNAAMASAALRTAELLGDRSLAEFSLRSLERVALSTYVPGDGVAHVFDGAAGVRGLLDDQVAMAAAHVDAYDATGDIAYEMMAEELAHYAIRTMWDDARGGFFDRVQAAGDERIGRMRDRLKPFVGNCEAARLLARLAASSGEPEFGARADATLACLAPRARAEGPLAAHYLLALREPRVR